MLTEPERMIHIRRRMSTEYATSALNLFAINLDKFFNFKNLACFLRAAQFEKERQIPKSFSLFRALVTGGQAGTNPFKKV